MLVLVDIQVPGDGLYGIITQVRHPRSFRDQVRVGGHPKTIRRMIGMSEDVVIHPALGELGDLHPLERVVHVHVGVLAEPSFEAVEYLVSGGGDGQGRVLQVEQGRGGGERQGEGGTGQEGRGGGYRVAHVVGMIDCVGMLDYAMEV